MLKILFSTLAILTLTSCASTNSYVDPEGNNIATIQGSHVSNSLFDWREAYVTTIDDKEISYLRQDTIGGFKGNKVINVLPGAHNFAVSASFNRQLIGSGPYETFLDLNATLRSNMQYHLSMNVHGATISVWIEDQFGKKVSTVASNNYRTMPRNNTVFISTPRN